MMPRLAMMLAALIAAGSTVFPEGAPSGRAQAADPVTVAASFYPLYEFASAVGGRRARVRNLVPPGVEPHAYEPGARDVAVLSKTRLLVYNGAGFEGWVQRLLPSLPEHVIRVNATAGLPLVGSDPHVWLDPVLAQQQVDNILAGFVRADPAHQSDYAAGAARLKADLQALHRRYAQTLQRCERRTFVTAHAAFGYLARRYGLTMLSIAGLSPEVEPSPARLREIVRVVRRHGVRVIYFETLVSPKVAQTIAREVGAATGVLNPVEGLTPDQQRRGETYVTVMHENLRQLAEGLGCR
ncbi:MAG: zinc ABC transporter substrate-binding protein [Armatimonadota bacterium]|nr:zinc ABC transporter substrate-binding protein [Armatimonadota bacterium]MDR7518162.1 zinc ABC transporter substrate-binding protein [Armatimonadota bacterium]MDR7550579.1 zinc ABC transporter substrate-binding protein [Armatimonadota bacterium]